MFNVWKILLKYTKSHKHIKSVVPTLNTLNRHIYLSSCSIIIFNVFQCKRQRGNFAAEWFWIFLFFFLLNFPSSIFILLFMRRAVILRSTRQEKSHLNHFISFNGKCTHFLGFMGKHPELKKVLRKCEKNYWGDVASWRDIVCFHRSEIVLCYRSWRFKWLKWFKWLRYMKYCFLSQFSDDVKTSWKVIQLPWLRKYPAKQKIVDLFSGLT